MVLWFYLAGHHVEEGDLASRGRHDVRIVLGEGKAGERIFGLDVGEVVGHHGARGWLRQQRSHLGCCLNHESVFVRIKKQKQKQKTKKKDKIFNQLDLNFEKFVTLPLKLCSQRAHFQMRWTPFCANARIQVPELVKINLEICDSDNESNYQHNTL